VIALAVGEAETEGFWLSFLHGLSSAASPACGLSSPIALRKPLTTRAVACVTGRARIDSIAAIRPETRTWVTESVRISNVTRDRRSLGQLMVSPQLLRHTGRERHKRLEHSMSKDAGILTVSRPPASRDAHSRHRYPASRKRWN
jgi:hypothetical protein